VEQALSGIGPVEAVRANRIVVTTAPDRIRSALESASRLACDHLVQIATIDTGREFELVYILTGPHRTVLSIRTRLPREAPRIRSVHDLLPPAGIYERQIHDLFGITFEGHPNLARIILNEDWPEDEYPLRKDWKRDPAKSYGGEPREVR
jgi:NADH-quinone oxidoreductase subunit C